MHSKTGSVVALALSTLTFGASSARADVCGCPSVGLFPGTPLAAVLHPTVEADVDGAFDLSVTAYLRIGKTSLGEIGTFNARATATPVAVDLPISSPLLKRARSIARQTGHARGMIEFVTTGPGLGRVTYESLISLLAPVRTTATRVDVGGSSLPAGQQARGSVLLRTPSWRRTSAPGVKLATFNAVPAGGSCVADLLAQASIRASKFAVTLLDDVGPGSTNGTARDAWRVQQSTPDATVPMLSAVGAHRVARNRYAVLKLNVGFRPGCPPTAANNPALVTALRRAVSQITAKSA